MGGGAARRHLVSELHLAITSRNFFYTILAKGFFGGIKAIGDGMPPERVPDYADSIFRLPIGIYNKAGLSEISRIGMRTWRQGK